MVLTALHRTIMATQRSAVRIRDAPLRGLRNAEEVIDRVVGFIFFSAYLPTGFSEVEDAST